MTNQTSRRFSRGWQFGLAIFVVTAAGTIARFAFGGHALPEDWRVLVYPLIVVAIGSVVVGLVFHGLRKDFRGPR